MANSIEEIAVDHPGQGYDGELTFVGVLRKYFVEYDDFGKNIGISKSWHKNTPGRYISDYERRLIPVMDDLFGKEKPLHSYLEEDFERILDELNKRHHYDDRTLIHYRHILWIVYQAGFEHGLYADNIFWYDVNDPLDQDERTHEAGRVQMMTRLRKSFSPEEERRIITWFQSLDPETASGEDIGLLLMYFEGLRNNEACGANYGSIRTLSGYEDVPVFDMLQSTRIGSNQVKAGGKTGNAPRTLPLFDMLYDFLMRRKRFLENMISAGEILLPPEIRSVDQLPIVCVKNNYTVRATSRDLAIAGRKLFEEIGVSRSELALLYQMLLGQEFKDNLIDEREPTTYLFRRNVATHLYHLGFSAAEIQYWLGHNIEDANFSRNDFSDEHTIYNLAIAYREHPVRVWLETDSKETEILDEDYFNTEPASNMDNNVSYNVRAVHPAFIIDLRAEEPLQPITIQVNSDEIGFAITVDATESHSAYLETVDIKRQKQKTYKKQSTYIEN